MLNIDKLAGNLPPDAVESQIRITATQGTIPLVLNALVKDTASIPPLSSARAYFVGATTYGSEPFKLVGELYREWENALPVELRWTSKMVNAKATPDEVKPWLQHLAALIIEEQTRTNATEEPNKDTNENG